MSASYETRDGRTYYPFKLRDDQVEMLSGHFDAQVEHDILEYKERIREEKSLKKMCYVKLLLFPIQYPVYLIFLGKLSVIDLIKNSKMCLRYVRGKISKDRFKRELMLYYKEPV